MVYFFVSPFGRCLYSFCIGSIKDITTVLDQNLFLTKQIPKMSDEISVNALRDLVQKQQTRIDDLEKRVQLAERQVEAAEQYSRQDCLILRGKLNIRPNCSLRDEVMRIIQHHTGMQFPPWCINTTHWLGKGDSIIVRFNNKGVRDAIYKNRVPKEVSKRGLFIHESLT